MSKISDKIMICFSIMFIIYVLILFVAIPEKELNENENRYLQTKPVVSVSSIMEGRTTLEIEQYVNDHFPYRDLIVGIKSDIELLMGKKTLNNVYVCKESEFLIECYDGYDRVVMDNQHRILNQFAVGNDNIYFVLAPTANSIYSAMKPIYNDDENQLDDIKEFYSGLENIQTIDISDDLINNSNRQLLYYRQDHHWSSYGAYYSYRCIAEHLNLKAYNIDDFNIIEVSDEFYGTLYSKSRYYRFSPDIVLIFEPNFMVELSVSYVQNQTITDSMYAYDYIDSKDKYSIFLNGNHSEIIIENLKIKNSDNILIIKDSYANSLVPFMVNHFTKTHVLDMRYYNENISEYIENHDIDIVMFVFNTDSFENDTGIYKLK